MARPKTGNCTLTKVQYLVCRIRPRVPGGITVSRKALEMSLWSVSHMGFAAGGQGGRPPFPPDFGENMDFFDFCNDKSDFLSIPPPPPDFRVQRTPWCHREVLSDSKV